MKKLLSIGVIVGIFCYGIIPGKLHAYNSYNENTQIYSNTKEIQEEIKKIREEIKQDTLASKDFTDFHTTESLIKQESKTLPLKNKLADLEYDLAIMEGRTVKIDELLNYGDRSYNDKSLRTGDILLYHQPIGFDAWTIATVGYTHAIFVLDETYGIQTGVGQRSRKVLLSDVLNTSFLRNSNYDKVVRKRIDLDLHTRNNMKSYANSNFLGKDYPNLIYLLSGNHTKHSVSELYCSQVPWLAYYNQIGIDIDYDGGDIVFPVDIYNSRYGTTDVITQ